MNPYSNHYEERGPIPKPEPTRVVLDEYNSDLNFVTEHDGVTGLSLHKNGFEYLWAGARATHGVSSGKVCYEVLVQEKLEVNMPNSQTSPHVMRVGWSTDGSNFTVGEDLLSYGYGGTGKSSCNNKFYNYGEPYSTNDVITCYIDLDANPKAIFFTKNGKYLDVAFRLGPETNGKVFYPHVTVKNMKFVANFGGLEPYFPPVQGFLMVQSIPSHMLIMPPASPRRREDCEVLMMVGLPSCGKTTWIQKYVKDNREKKYNVLGTNDILVKMKVMGLTRKRNYHGRWDALIKQATGILNEMLKVAQRKNRNYILDQTNVYPNARRRKMNNFRGFRHVAVVMVTTNEVLMERNAKVVRQDGKVVPESAFMEMKANFTLPVEGEIFDEVWYVEENKERSEQLVSEFNEEGRMWKDEEKKRPAGDQQSSGQPFPDTKKPKYGAPTNLNQQRNQPGAGYQDNRGRDYVDSSGMARNMARTGPGGFNDHRHGNRPPGRREDFTRRESYPRNEPPPSGYPQPSKKNTYQAQEHGPSDGNYASDTSYYSTERGEQQYGQQRYSQSQPHPHPEPQQTYNTQSLQYDNPPGQYPGHFGGGAGYWDSVQMSGNPGYQDYHGGRQHTVPPAIKQESIAQQLSYSYQGQYGNYQQYQYQYQ